MRERERERQRERERERESERERERERGIPIYLCTVRLGLSKQFRALQNELGLTYH